jgi:hypothetical protein
VGAVRRGSELSLVALLACLSLATAAAPQAMAHGAIEDASVSLSQKGSFDRQAGSHPDLTFTLSTPLITRTGVKGPYQSPAESLRDIVLDLPPGLVGNATAAPTCTESQLASVEENGVSSGASKCPTGSQIGVANVLLSNRLTNGSTGLVPLYNMAHGPDTPALFGFEYVGYPALIEAKVRPAEYGVSSGGFGVLQAEPIRGVEVTVWGVPGDPEHDSHRFAPSGAENVPSEAPLRPFLTSPTSCSGSPSPFSARADTWQNVGLFDVRSLETDADGTPFVFEGCSKLSFAPSLSARPTTSSADAPSGLSVDLSVPQNEGPRGLASSQVRSVSLQLPRGMSVSPSSAAGLGACSEAEVGLKTDSVPSCPESSKIGSVRIKTPLLEEELEGGMYLAKQRENPFGSLLALYLIAKGPGFYLKLPGKVVADAQTGQLTVTFADTPQLPFEDLRVDLKSGQAAPLQMPRACGSYAIKAEITPWSGTAPVTAESVFSVSQGCKGTFSPGLKAGTARSTGGSYSPFYLQVTRADGEANLAQIKALLPSGLLAKLAGVTVCGEAQAVTGDCPAASQVGQTTVGVGPGASPIYVPEPGRAPTAVYLAGPYKGAPYSLVVKVPAQAGPFDLGTVVVRNALRIDPTTTQVTAESDPLPQILEGIPISYRDVRVEVTRPEFTLNPTNCKQMVVSSVLTSAGGQTASPQAPFAAANCERLGFKPDLKIALRGRMTRSGNPALTATLKAPKGEANIATTAVILPKSQFIDNSHINNPCTRVQFNEGKCPPKSILGTATAFTPLLDKPLSGPVYFRSNGGERELPDLVADLNGQIHVVLVGFIDSVRKKGAEISRVRTRFQSVPDAPVSKFVLKLKGGKRGLLENSVNLCRHPQRATVQMQGQNGKPHDSTATIATSCGGKGGRAGTNH